MPQPIQLNILLADDDDIVRVSIAAFLAVRGHRVVEANDGMQALQHLRKNTFDVVITDIKMPGADGFAILSKCRQNTLNTEVIMVTGFGDIQLAVRAMREGACDFFTKPVKLEELSTAFERIERIFTLRQERDQARLLLDQHHTEARQRHGLHALIGQSSAIQSIKTLVQQVAQTETTSVLVTGETGTGKEVVARAIHHESSRSGNPFLAVDCTAIPDNLFESAFYGHEKGAFTDARETHQGHFEQANEGTLFLDEIGDMPLDMQVRLLRTLEERHIRRVGGNREIPVDVRIISATNQNLEEAITTSRFRGDLYHRINTFIIHLPPLRERPGDIMHLARHYLDLYVRELRKPILNFSPEASARLQSHPFQGNVRELKNTIERAVILCQNEHIEPENLQFPSAASVPQVPLDTSDVNTILQALPDKALTLEQAEAQIIREALRRCNWNRGLTAKLLGLSRYALRRRMQVHGIE